MNSEQNPSRSHLPIPSRQPAGRNAFTGRIKAVQLDISGAESLDHLVDPETAIRIAMARQ